MSVMWYPELRKLEQSTKERLVGFAWDGEVDQSALLYRGVGIEKRSSRLGLGRVSVLKGEGSHMGEPCIDDCTCATEPLYDYVCPFLPSPEGGEVSQRLVHCPAGPLRLRSGHSGWAWAESAFWAGSIDREEPCILEMYLHH